MKAKQYSVVTNGETFRLIDGDGNFYEEATYSILGPIPTVQFFKTKEEAEQKARQISWELC